MEKIAAWIDREHRSEIIAGGTTAAALMYAQYVHARRAGLASAEPGTETTGGGGRTMMIGGRGGRGGDGPGAGAVARVGRGHRDRPAGAGGSGINFGKSGLWHGRAARNDVARARVKSIVVENRG